MPEILTIITDGTKKIEDFMIYGRQTKTAELAEKLRNELLAERLAKDSPVMSVRELAEHFSVSTVTANRVLNLLVDQDILYRKPQSGTFIKHEPPVIPAVAYAGPLPDPENADPIKNDATLSLLEHFTELGIKPMLIPFHTLRHPALAERELRRSNGLLIDASFIDGDTLKTLWNYPGRIVIAGNSYIENRLPCSQVIPDFTEVLLEFDRFSPFAEYDQILILSAGHRNSIAGAETVRQILDRRQVAEKKIEEIRLETSGAVNAYMRASRYFSQCGKLPEKTLIVSMSEYFSQAVREVFFSRESMPDILSFDNLEGHGKEPEESPFFTSVDCRMGLTVCRALDLLCGQLKNPKQEQTILRIPAKLIIRKSVKKKTSAGRPRRSRPASRLLFPSNNNMEEEK